MKSIVKSYLLLAILFATSTAFAQQQQRRTPEERAQNQVQWMQKNLSITDDQGKKAYDIILRYAKEAQNTMGAPAGNDKKEAMEKMQQDRESELKGILTGDQYQKYLAHVQEMQEKMRERRNGMQ